MLLDVLAGYPADARERFLVLPGQVHRPGDLAVEIVPRAIGGWTVAICTLDFLGAFSLVVGLLTAYRLEIVGAEILTLRSAEPGFGGASRRPRARYAFVGSDQPTRVLFDVFEVRPLDDSFSDPWERFRSDLAELLRPDRRAEARDEIIDRVSEAMRAFDAGEARLLPVALDLANDTDRGGKTLTRLAVRSADTPGFLFAFTSGLAGIGIDVARAEIRTADGEARDRFWVTDAQGRPISDAWGLQRLRIATTLIKQFTYLLPRSPDPAQALRQFNALIVQLLSRPEWTSDLIRLGSPAVLETLADLMGVSRFLWEDFLRLQHENLFPLLLDVPTLTAPRSMEVLQSDLEAELLRAPALAGRVEALNQFKDREMFRIDLRHIVGQSGFAEFSGQLSALAEVAVGAGVRLVAESLQPRLGLPRLPDGVACPLSVCALGKFGGGELGFGSDLELIFVYAGPGQTDGPAEVPNSEYFIGLVQAFLQTLRARQEGIFEIDLRLRPFARAGALASSLDGFARYYAPSGAAEQFERLALVRLRPVAGDAALGRQVQAARDRFVYSGQPLDLGNILHLRQRQSTELVPRGKVNVKYSRGGLVDLEYFVQSWQITVGATDPRVRVPNTLAAIGRLEEGGYLSVDLAEEARQTYDFLRRASDSLRVVRGNAKDLNLPPEGSREFAYLARRLKLSSPAALQGELARRMTFAESLWDVAPPR